MNNLQRLWANGSVKFGAVVLGTMICVARNDATFNKDVGICH